MSERHAMEQKVSTKSKSKARLRRPNALQHRKMWWMYLYRFSLGQSLSNAKSRMFLCVFCMLTDFHSVDIHLIRFTFEFSCIFIAIESHSMLNVGNKETTLLLETLTCNRIHTDQLGILARLLLLLFDVCQHGKYSRYLSSLSIRIDPIHFVRSTEFSRCVLTMVVSTA